MPATPDSQTAAVLTAEHLSFGFPGRWLFSGWSHAFAPGLTWVRGANGSGKSTLLKLLGGALEPGAGRLRCLGVQADAAPQDYRRQVFWCGPERPAFDHLKPGEYFGFLAGLYPGFDAAALAQDVAALGLAPFMGKPLAHLSTGTGRKVALAAALAAGTPVVLLDEPLAALDRASVRHVQQRLAALAEDGARSGRAWIVTSHEPLGPAEPWAQVLDLDASAAAPHKGADDPP